MIASIQGIITGKRRDHLIVVVNGLGYQVFTTDAVMVGSPEGEEILLHTSLVVREDSLTLYGFKTTSERDVFELVTTVSGIGPRLGLAMISTMTVENLRSAIVSERDELLTRIPGIGKKTAKKIILELKDKMMTRDSLPIEAFEDDNVNADVMDALLALGYSVVEAQSAIQALPKDAPDNVAERTRLALQSFA